METLWKKKMTLRSFEKKNTLPETPGVYFFLDASGRILYIGKATSLRDRVRSYFTQDLMETRGPKIERMRGLIAAIAYQPTDSVLEALLLEGRLIKDKQPPYNTDAKDDKSYNHVVITQERFPRVLLVRGRDLEQKKFLDPIKYLYGPFPQGGALREALVLIRQLFPYRDRCTPYEVLSQAQKKKARECFSAQIGLCPGVCMDRISMREYSKTINHIRLFFEGHKKKVLRSLEREMKKAAREYRFERAAEIKKTIFSLKHIEDMALIKDDAREIQPHRIEGYDVAHLLGEASVGVMTVVAGSRSLPSEYRQFRLRLRHNGNDLSALQEVLSRRLKHPEWPLPELIVVDGSRWQLKQAEDVLSKVGLTIPVVGVVKDIHHKAARLIGPEGLLARFKKEILLVNSEAHRFAIGFHRKRRRREFLQK